MAKAKPWVFYGLKEDHQETVRIKFKANPRPTEGKWMIGDVAVPVGGTEAEFTSTDFTAGVSFKICKSGQNCLKRPNLFIFFFFFFFAGCGRRLHC